MHQNATSTANFVRAQFRNFTVSTQYCYIVVPYQWLIAVLLVYCRSRRSRHYLSSGALSLSAEDVVLLGERLFQ
jgi:hypothetical protein